MSLDDESGKALWERSEKFVMERGGDKLRLLALREEERREFAKKENLEIKGGKSYKEGLLQARRPKKRKSRREKRTEWESRGRGEDSISRNFSRKRKSLGACRKGEGPKP